MENFNIEINENTVSVSQLKKIVERWLQEYAVSLFFGKDKNHISASQFGTSSDVTNVKGFDCIDNVCREHYKDVVKAIPVDSFEAIVFKLSMLEVSAVGNDDDRITHSPRNYFTWAFVNDKILSTNNYMKYVADFAGETFSNSTLLENGFQVEYDKASLKKFNEGK